MIGDVAAAIRGEEGDARALQDLRAGQQVFVVAIAAHGDHVRMLQQQKLVGRRPLLAGGDQLLLQFQRRAVAHPPEFAHLALTH